MTETLQQDIYLDLKAIPVYRRLLPQMQRHRVIQACFVKLTDMSNLLNLGHETEMIDVAT